MKQRRRTRPFTPVAPAELDMTLPPALRELPQRIAEANEAGPRYQLTELAAASGLSTTALSRLGFYERLGGMRVDTLCRIAAALNVSVSTLLGDTTPTVRKKTAVKRPTPKPARKKKRARAR